MTENLTGGTTDRESEILMYHLVLSLLHYHVNLHEEWHAALKEKILNHSRENNDNNHINI